MIAQPIAGKPKRTVLGAVKYFFTGPNRAFRASFLIFLIAYLIASYVNDHAKTGSTGAMMVAHDFLRAFMALCIVMGTSSFLGTIRPYFADSREYDALLTAMEQRFIIQDHNAARVRVMKKLDLDHVADCLEEGDTLKIMVTWQVRFDNPDWFRHVLDEKRANVEILMLKPESQRATERLVEIGKGNSLQLAPQQIRTIIMVLEQLVQSLADRPQSGSLSFRLLDGAVRSPLYLVCRRGVYSHALTGFYLDKSDEENLYLEWHRPSKPAAGDRTADFLDGMGKYFGMKWDQGVSGAHPPPEATEVPTPEAEVATSIPAPDQD